MLFYNVTRYKQSKSHFFFLLFLFSSWLKQMLCYTFEQIWQVIFYVVTIIACISDIVITNYTIKKLLQQTHYSTKYQAWGQEF